MADHHFGFDADDEARVYDRLTTTPGSRSAARWPAIRAPAPAPATRCCRATSTYHPVSFSEALGAPDPDERTMIADPWVVEMHPADGYASVSIGVLDLMGAMDGINEAGLTDALLADNGVPQEPTFGTSAVGLAEPQVVRFLLDTCADGDEAKAALLGAKHSYAFISCHFVVADRSGRTFIWEHSPLRNLERIVEPPPGSHGRLVCTNHLVHMWPDADALPEDGGPPGTAALTFERFKTLAESTRAGSPVDRDDIAGHFAPVTFGSSDAESVTVWHGLYDLDARAVEVIFHLGGPDHRSEPITFSLGA